MCGSPEDGNIANEEECYDGKNLNVIQNGDLQLAHGELCLCNVGLCNGKRFEEEDGEIDPGRSKSNGLSDNFNVLLLIFPVILVSSSPRFPCNN